MAKKEKNWVDDTVVIYDFIWSSGAEMCGFHLNEALLEDFRNGGKIFEQMKQKIFEKYPTFEDVLKEFHKTHI